MTHQLSAQAQSDLEFLNKLAEEELIGWPIDYEVYSPSQEEIADTLDSWLGGAKWRNSNHSFIQFGQDGTGSLFCFWLYPNLKAEPPVIFLGSEGERAVVANNSHDFVKQLTSGKLFYDGNWIEPDEEAKEELDWNYLSEVAIKYLGSINTDPAQLSKSAISSHPDLNSWIENNVE